MRANPKLVLITCAAIIVLGLAIFILRDNAGEVPQPLPTHAKTDPHPEAPLYPINQSSSHPATSSQSDYFPLSDTFQRNYLVEVSYLGRDTRFGIAKLAVEGRESIRGNEYYKLLLRVIGIPEMRDPVLRYCRNAGYAWRELEGGGREPDPAFETVTMPLPPREGAIWDKDTPAERSNWKIEGAETVALFGKPYSNCLRISYERHLKQEPDYFETGHYFLAADVGLIKQVAMVAGTRITFTLDHRAPEEIAFCARLTGTYKGIRNREMSGGQIQLSADGRYTMIRSTADSAVDGGRYEPNPGREGEMLLLDDHGITIVCSYHRKELGFNHSYLYLKCITPIDLPGEEYIRDGPDRPIEGESP